uniref:Uncharacterized protein n=1 Tax=Octopus bimaculoides TaxID=37653 RepID=A0A0L8IHZ4_OCTBM
MHAHTHTHQRARERRLYNCEVCMATSWKGKTHTYHSFPPLRPTDSPPCIEKIAIRMWTSDEETAFSGVQHSFPLFFLPRGKVDLPGKNRERQTDRMTGCCG